MLNERLVRPQYNLPATRAASAVRLRLAQACRRGEGIAVLLFANGKSLEIPIGVAPKPPWLDRGAAKADKAPLRPCCVPAATAVKTLSGHVTGYGAAAKAAGGYPPFRNSFENRKNYPIMRASSPTVEGRLFLLAGAVFSAGAALPAQAQNVAAEAASETAATRSGDGLDDIVVTAQRQNDRLQDVPVTVSAFSATRLEARQVHSLIDIVKDGVSQA